MRLMEEKTVMKWTFVNVLYYTCVLKRTVKTEKKLTVVIKV